MFHERALLQLGAAIGEVEDYQVQVLGRIESIDWGTINGTGNEFGNGDDVVTTGIGRDIVIGGGGADVIHAFGSAAGTAAGDLNNIVFGDHGVVDYLVAERAALLATDPPRTADIDPRSLEMRSMVANRSSARRSNTA